MIAAGQFLYGETERAGSPLGRSMLSRLGSELALVYHDVMQAPLPGRWQTLVDDLDQAMASPDRSQLDEVSDPLRRDGLSSRRD